MLFNSFPFIALFLPFVLIIAMRLKGQMLLGWIALASLAFYAFVGKVWFLCPLLITTTLDYFLAQRMEKAEDKKSAILILSLTCNLGLLFYFKYFNLFIRTLLHFPQFFS